MFTYLLINIFTLAGPLGLSFDKKVAFWRSWRALLPAVLITGTLFIVWDVWFTREGVWGFNPDYLTGLYLFHLPLGEWLFFLTVPYACIFIYACVKAYLPGEPLRKVAPWVFRGLLVILPVLAVLFSDQLYTLVTFAGLSLLIALNLFVFRTPYLGHFLLAYLIALVPFLVVNGVLTALPVVWYNDLENFGIRLGTIPVEDTMYNMWLLLMNVNIYEWILARQRQRQPAASVIA
ncbi:MAG: lycopene cyclase domain-containing protein [Bacteroidetes bacterium]|nr:MAG: lycopene cyclase domain-containing protein [Bacteroidota bacterium]